MSSTAVQHSPLFNAINHSVLAKRLGDTLGINGAALSSLKSYHNSRWCFIKIRNDPSITTTSDNGIPQGSCLGHYYFLFTTTFGKVIARCGIKFHRYTDDMQIVLHSIKLAVWLLFMIGCSTIHAQPGQVWGSHVRYSREGLTAPESDVHLSSWDFNRLPHGSHESWVTFDTRLFSTSTSEKDATTTSMVSVMCVLRGQLIWRTWLPVPLLVQDWTIATLFIQHVGSEPRQTASTELSSLADHWHSLTWSYQTSPCPALLATHKSTSTFKIATMVFKIRRTNQPSYLVDMFEEYKPQAETLIPIQAVT